MGIEEIKQSVQEHSSFLIICILYMLLTIPFLGSSPLIWYDEGVSSEVSWHFANEGTFKQPLWTGYLNLGEFSTHPNYGYFLILALFFKLFGFGIIQARLVSVIAGLFLLAAVYYLTKQMTTKRTAVIATLVLALNPLFILSARMVRQEMTLILFGFLAFSLIVLGSKEQSKRKMWYFLLAGIAAAYAILVHLNGIFITLALCGVIISCRCWKSLFYFILGLFIGLSPYIIFLLLNWETFSTQFLGLWGYRLPGQTSILANIALEVMRWKKGLTAPISIVLGVFACIWMLPHIKKWKFLYIPLIVIIAYFTLFDYNKYYGYLLLLLPFFSMIAAVMVNDNGKKEKTQKIIFFILLIFLISNVLLIEFKIMRDSQYDYQQYCDSLKEVADGKEVILADPSLLFCFPDGNIRDFMTQIWIKEDTRLYKDILAEQRVKYIILDPITKVIVQGKGGLFKTDASYYEAIIVCKKIREIPSYTLNEEESVEIYGCENEKD